MKLRNKKTGEIVELDHISAHYSRHYEHGKDRSGEQPCSTWNKTLAELNEEWEDYEKPKGYWFIAGRGAVIHEIDRNTIFDRGRKEMGNCFKTEEEAKKAATKLKAWKRLKDNGFKFNGWTRYADGPGDVIEIRLESRGLATGFTKEIDLLFGGGE